MKYVQSISMQSVLGGIGSVRFRAGSIYDPYYEVGGHQPYGFDTWSTMYNHYVVSGAKITLKLVDAQGTYVPTILGIYLSDDASTGFASWTTYMEANRGTSRILPSTLTRPLLTNSYYSAKKFFNITDVKDNVTRIGSAITGNPNEAAIFHCWIQSQDGASTSPLMTGTVTISYNVTFSEPKDLEAS